MDQLCDSDADSQWWNSQWRFTFTLTVDPPSPLRDQLSEQNVTLYCLSVSESAKICTPIHYTLNVVTLLTAYQAELFQDMGHLLGLSKSDFLGGDMYYFGPYTLCFKGCRPRLSSCHGSGCGRGEITVAKSLQTKINRSSWIPL